MFVPSAAGQRLAEATEAVLLEDVVDDGLAVLVELEEACEITDTDAPVVRT